MCKFHKEYYGVEFCGEESESLMEKHKIKAGRTKNEEHLRRLKLRKMELEETLRLNSYWIKQVKRKIQEGK